MTPASSPRYNVLFLCTGNSARSILAEAILRHLAGDRFNSHSAGSHPTGVVNPHALAYLARNHIPTEGLRSKSWDEFAAPGAPELHFVFTVCDNAAGEVCPVWPGRPANAHWGVPDPAAFEGSDEARQRHFAEVAQVLTQRIRLFTSLPLATLERVALEQRLREIGRQ